MKYASLPSEITRLEPERFPGHVEYLDAAPFAETLVRRKNDNARLTGAEILVLNGIFAANPEQIAKAFYTALEYTEQVDPPSRHASWAGRIVINSLVASAHLSAAQATESLTRATQDLGGILECEVVSYSNVVAKCRKNYPQLQHDQDVAIAGAFASTLREVIDRGRVGTILPQFSPTFPEVYGSKEGPSGGLTVFLGGVMPSHVALVRPEITDHPDYDDAPLGITTMYVPPDHTPDLVLSAVHQCALEPVQADSRQRFAHGLAHVVPSFVDLSWRQIR